MADWWDMQKVANLVAHLDMTTAASKDGQTVEEKACQKVERMADCSVCTKVDVLVGHWALRRVDLKVLKMVECWAKRLVVMMVAKMVVNWVAKLVERTA